MAAKTMPVTNDPAANALLVQDPLALLIGMLLDQQIPMEWAFAGPRTLQERLGGTLDAKAIAAMPPDELEAVFKQKPALHRYPGSMAGRTQDLCAFIAETYDGDAGKVWKGVRSGDELFRRVRELPGYGEQKAKILVAILAKRLGKAPSGWQEVASPYGDDEPRSVADIDGPGALERVRAFKQAQKQAAKKR